MHCRRLIAGASELVPEMKWKWYLWLFTLSCFLFVCIGSSVAALMCVLDLFVIRLDVGKMVGIRASKNPLMKLLGIFGVGLSSVWKYFITCESCFQKLSVSYRTAAISPIHSHIITQTEGSRERGWRQWGPSYLEFLVAIEEQHIDGPQLVYISMPLELLSHLRPDRRHGEVQRVHGLDLGALCASISIASTHILLAQSPSHHPVSMSKSAQM